MSEPVIELAECPVCGSSQRIMPVDAQSGAMFREHARQRQQRIDGFREQMRKSITAEAVAPWREALEWCVDVIVTETLEAVPAAISALLDAPPADGES